MNNKNALYIYCITKGEIQLKNINGLNNRKVYPITDDNITVLIHNCNPEPYQGKDKQVKKWVLQHNQVVEKVWKHKKSVLRLF